jgi:outer membrane protein OmpA-like peptidoglycan-associated protein
MESRFMSAQTNAAVNLQREELVNKVELEVERKINLDTLLYQYHRIILQDLPFNGQPALLDDEHRQAIEKLVDKHLLPSYQIRIGSITGYASSIGEGQNNLLLSQVRAAEVHRYLLEIMDSMGIPHADMLKNNFQVSGKGESELIDLGVDAQDSPVNRRVEIVYVLKVTLPQPTGNASTASTQWKIDFGPTGSGFFLSGGVGTLTMLPDGANGPATAITKSIKFEQLGISVGLFEKLKKLKFVERFPLLKRLLKGLDSDGPANYAKTTNLLQNIGFSVDIVNTGGEFETSEALTFKDMQSFNYATVSAGLSILGKAEGALFMLHSGYFFAYTVIFGAGQNIAVPDAELSFVPAGFVQVTLEEG